MLPSRNDILLFACVVHVAYGLRTATRDRKRGLPNDTDESTTVPNTTKVTSQSCKSRVYCESELLHDVQMARIYPDSKTFVDMKLKYDESDIIAKYKTLKGKYGGQVPPNAELIKFVDENLEVSDELEEWILPDFNDNPSIVDRVSDPAYKQWAASLNLAWKTLARKVKDDVRTSPDKYSMIWVPNGFIIPGGRFKELYYWDTYWIVNGLLLCDMKDTARGVIDNILSLVREYGFMPNGGRVYYLNRSQPPMLILMVLSYYETTNDFDYVERVIGDLEDEFSFWITNRTFEFHKNSKPYKMARYSVSSNGPRPESYREDYETAKHLDDQKDKEKFYEEIKSGVETGWDFSSRWFITANGTNRGKMADIYTRKIIPVDLNSILQKNAALLGTWFGRMGNELKADYYNNIAEQYLKNIHEVMWRGDRGVWFDWDLTNHKHREYFYASNIVPLWTESHGMLQEAAANSVIKYLQDQSIIGRDYNVCYKGVPASLYYSTQQWDYSNAWPPLQAFIIQGLYKTKNFIAKYVAQKLTDVWLNTNYKGFVKNSAMHEKYDVLAEGESGGGGEYEAQTGFGWTNGVVFELLNQWSESTIYLKENTTNQEKNMTNCIKPKKEL